MIMQLLHDASWLNILGWCLLNSLGQMSLLWIIYLIITLGGKKWSASIRHTLALFLVSLGTLWFFISLSNSFTKNPTIGQINKGASIYTAEQASKLFSLQQLLNIVLPYISILYLIVLVFLLFRHLQSYFITQQLKKNNLLKAPWELRLFVENISKKMGILKEVKVYLSSIIETPMVIGFLKPVILIPMATINHLSMEQMEAVLLHEIVHIKRNDYLFNWWVSFLQTLFFFNPFVAQLAQAIKKEREHCCDDAVLDFQYERSMYASALLILEKMRQQHPTFALAVIGKNKKHLLYRVMRVMKQKKTDREAKYRFTFNMAFALISFFALLLPAAKTTIIKEDISPRKAFAYNTGLQKMVEEKTLSFFPLPEKRAGIVIKGKLDYEIEGQNKVAETIKKDFELVYDTYQPDDKNLLFNSAIASEPLSFSFQPSGPTMTTINLNQNNYPYVPKATFEYQEIEDSTAPKPLIDQAKEDAKNAQIAFEKTKAALNAIDWKKIRKDLKLNSQQFDMDKLQKQIQENIALLDWKTINENINEATNDAKEKRIRNDLQVQLETLQTLRQKDFRKAEELQQQILLQQLKLQKSIIQKQQELLRKLEEMQAKAKIIYI